MMTKVATVLGAGIQGVCVAFMLKKHGYRVQLVDKSDDIMNRASLTYEGKLHLGFVYGMDKSLQTGYRMVSDALHFAPYLEYLLGGSEDWEPYRSKPNIYLVAQDSMLSTEELETYFAKLDKQFQDSLADERLHYLGTRPQRLARRIDIPAYVSPELICAAFLTEELSVDQVLLKNRLKRSLSAGEGIQFLGGHEVRAVTKIPNGFSVECQVKEGGGAMLQSDIVCNCLWEKRIYFDRAMGFTSEPAQSLRLKYGLLLRADAFLRSIHSLTMIHGPFGNLVVNLHHDRVFCSWYPASLKGLIEYGNLPDAWERACDGYTSPELIEQLSRDNLDAFRRIIPEMGDLEVLAAKAGVIIAEGTRDITERDSAFHSRNDKAIAGLDGYFSVNTSKYTSAPRNAMLLEEIIAVRA